MGVAYCMSVAENNSKKNHLDWYVNVIMLIVCVKYNYTSIKNIKNAMRCRDSRSAKCIETR